MSDNTNDKEGVVTPRPYGVRMLHSNNKLHGKYNKYMVDGSGARIKLVNARIQATRINVPVADGGSGTDGTFFTFKRLQRVKTIEGQHVVSLHPLHLSDEAVAAMYFLQESLLDKRGNHVELNVVRMESGLPNPVQLEDPVDSEVIASSSSAGWDQTDEESFERALHLVKSLAARRSFYRQLYNRALGQGD